MSAHRRTSRDERRRRLGQNFLLPAVAERLVSDCELRAGELVVEMGAGRGVLSSALARRGVDLISLEIDKRWAAELSRRLEREAPGRSWVVVGDFLAFRLPERPFRVVANVPFGETTAILRRLLDDPRSPIQRADLVVQREVARKRAAVPPASLLSTTWAPWWQFELGRRIPASSFRPVPSVDAAVLVVTRRDPPLLPPALARPYAEFVRARWPLDGAG